MERVVVTLPPELLEAVDSYAEQHATKRSQVVRQALQEWLAKRRSPKQQEEFEALMAEGYQEMAELLAELAAESVLAQAAAAEKSWRWDD